MRLNWNVMLIAAVCVSGCGQSTNNGNGAGGTTSAGGTSTPGTGGATGVGGSATGTGGGSTVATGGASGGGGAKETGGSMGTGGSSAGTGGRAGSSGGTGGGAGSVGAGGAGGIMGSGGGPGAGGTTGMGGGNADGGRRDAATGGASASGGSSGSGGSTGSDEGTFVPDPGWACGMASGIPAPKQGTLAFTITLQIGATHDVGDTPYGHRRLLDVKGGTISGDKLKGSVVTGGLEYELTLSNGVVEYQGINILKTSDGALVYVRSCGVSPDADSVPRVIPDFEASTSGSAAFLNTGKFVATRVLNATGGTGTLQLDVYDVSKVTAGEPRITITKPAGVPKQPWDCNTTTGTKGASIFTETVTLGGSMSIANAKRGSRNIIPITGGTTTGNKVVGAILNGGADYQLSGSLDAWYTLAPSDGEFILVRNCGPMGKLIPWFEARVAGPYNFLNTSAYLSSDPGGAGGGVSITFYERK